MCFFDCVSRWPFRVFFSSCCAYRIALNWSLHCQGSVFEVRHLSPFGLCQVNDWPIPFLVLVLVSLLALNYLLPFFVFLLIGGTP